MNNNRDSWKQRRIKLFDYRLSLQVASKMTILLLFHQLKIQKKKKFLQSMLSSVLIFSASFWSFIYLKCWRVPYFLSCQNWMWFGLLRGRMNMMVRMEMRDTFLFISLFILESGKFLCIYDKDLWWKCCWNHMRDSPLSWACSK